MSRRARHGGWIAAVLLGIGLVRLFAVVLHAPLAGYGNQYDMARTSACLGLWPDVPVAEQAQATPEAPRTDYRRGGDIGPACYPSTAVAMARVALVLDALVDRLRGDATGSFDLRQLGLLYALVAAGIALSLHRGLRGRRGWQVGHAAAFALLLADPFNTLFFNTLYTEAPALLALYAALAVMLRLALGARPGPLVPALALALLALGFSRVQHLLQPLALALPAAWLLWTRGRGARAAGIGVLLLALAVPVLQLRQQQASPGIAAANRTNTVMAGLLPAAADPGRMAVRLGLPASCSSLEHVSWYLRRGRDVAAECPALATVSLSRMAAALALEPRAALVFAGRGLAQATAWRLPYLGEVAGADHARLAHPSLADALAARGFMLHAVLWLVPLLVALCCLPAVLGSRAEARHWLLLCCVAVAGVGWTSALLGDGYSELTRHLHLAQNAILLGWGVLLAWVGHAAYRREWSSVAGAAAALLLATTCAVAWLRLPLAEGLLQVAAAADGGLRLHGWVLDPSGVHTIRLVVAGEEHAVPLLPAPDVARIFPITGQAGPAQARFDLTVSARPPGDAWIALQVTGTHGRHSDADGLRLDAALGPPAERAQ